MGWLRTLNPRQRLIIGSLTLVLVTAAALLTWTVTTTMRSMPSVSLLPTWTLEPPTATFTPAPPTVTLTPSPTPPFEASRAGDIARDISEARRLLPRWETPLTLVDLYDLSVVLYRRYEEQPPFPLPAEPLLRALEVWPEEETRLDVVSQAEETAALYMPRERQLYLRRDWEDSEEVLRTQVAYGYAHALPEQYGDLQRLRAEASLDHRLALDALAQGDALLTLWRYADVQPGSRRAKALTEMVAAAVLPRWQGENPTLEALARLPMELGSEFAAAIYETEGSQAMEEIMVRPPRTTEQLLHPERYGEGGAFTLLEPVAAEMAAGWEITQSWTVGQALMHFTLETWAGGTLTRTLDGWDGDLLQLWVGPEDEEVLLWQTRWDSREQAEAFAAQMSTLLPARIRGVREEPLPPNTPVGIWSEGRNGATFLRRRGEKVWLVWGTDRDAVHTLAGETRW
ncbi:MAG: hypothetical protein ACLFU8_00335 [Anaerolineales bacterium]